MHNTSTDSVISKAHNSGERSADAGHYSNSAFIAGIIGGQLCGSRYLSKFGFAIFGDSIIIVVFDAAACALSFLSSEFHDSSTV